MQGARCKEEEYNVQGAMCKVQGGRVQCARCKEQCAMCNVQCARCNVQGARRKSAARNWASGEDWALGGVGEHVDEQILRIALATTGSMFPHYINGYAWFFIRFQWG